MCTDIKTGLRSFEINPNILHSFYLSTVQSVLVLGDVCWGGNIYILAQERNRLESLRVIKKAEKVVGRKLCSLESIYVDRLTNKRLGIQSDSTHPLYKEFEMRRIDRSGRCRVPVTNTNRFKHSFIPRAILDHNMKTNRSEF